MATEAETALIKNVSGQKSVSVDGTSVEQYDISELIEADRYLSSKVAARKGLGMKMTKVIPPGAI